MTDRRPLALMLDFDGTLAPIGPTPDAIAVTDTLRRLVASAAERLEGRVALVSGRSLAQLDALWGPDLGGLTVAASHGLELRHDGHYRSPPPPEVFPELIRDIRQHFPAEEGLVVEPKSFGIGLHYRLAPGHREAVRAWAEAAAAAHGLVVQPGDMVFELRPPGPDKGDAVRTIMALVPFDGSRPLYIGDDLTDIPAIAAARAFGGRGLAVGSRIAAHADGMLASPEAVLEHLRALTRSEPAAFIT